MAHRKIKSKEIKKNTNIQTTSRDIQLGVPAHILTAEQPAVRADSKNSPHGFNPQNKAFSNTIWKIYTFGCICLGSSVNIHKSNKKN